MIYNENILYSNYIFIFKSSLILLILAYWDRKLS